MQNNKKCTPVWQNKKNLSLYEFPNFFDFRIFPFNPYILKQKIYLASIYGSFSFLFGHQNKKLIKNIFVNSGYLKSKQEFSIFPLLFFVITFVVRGGSI